MLATHTDHNFSLEENISSEKENQDNVMYDVMYDDIYTTKLTNQVMKLQVSHDLVGWFRCVNVVIQLHYKIDWATLYKQWFKLDYKISVIVINDNIVMNRLTLKSFVSMKISAVFQTQKVFCYKLRSSDSPN